VPGGSTVNSMRVSVDSGAPGRNSLSRKQVGWIRRICGHLIVCASAYAFGIGAGVIDYRLRPCGLGRCLRCGVGNEGSWADNARLT
jgi:hypothetical protein